MSFSNRHGGFLEQARYVSRECLFHVQGDGRDKPAGRAEVEARLTCFELALILNRPFRHDSLLGTRAARNGLRFLSKSREAEGRRHRLKTQGGRFVKNSITVFYEYPLEAHRAGVFNGCRRGSEHPERGRLERKRAGFARLRDLVGRVRFSGPMLTVQSGRIAPVMVWPSSGQILAE